MLPVAPRPSDVWSNSQKAADAGRQKSAGVEAPLQSNANGGQSRATAEPIDPPTHPGEWTLEQIVATLSRPLPKAMLETKHVGGTGIPFISWYTVNRILNKYAPGWTWEIRTMITSGDRLFLVGRLTIPTADGPVWREATGTEELKEVDRRTGELKEISYGDPSSNAESMAFRRAAARFGLGLYLYE